MGLQTPCTTCKTISLCKRLWKLALTACLATASPFKPLPLMQGGPFWWWGWVRGAGC